MVISGPICLTSIFLDQNPRKELRTDDWYGIRNFLEFQFIDIIIRYNGNSPFQNFMGIFFGCDKENNFFVLTFVRRKKLIWWESGRLKRAKNVICSFYLFLYMFVDIMKRNERKRIFEGFAGQKDRLSQIFPIRKVISTEN